MSSSREVFQLRKSSRLEDALEMARECYAANSNDLWTQRAYGWVLYDLVKHEVEEFEAERVPPGHLANRFNAWLMEYRQFGENDRPGMLHSHLLQQVLKGSRVWHGFLDFARWWGPEYFSEEDRKPFTPPNGREMPSLATRYFYALGREASHRASEIPADLLAWAEAQVDGALQELPNDQWLHYYKSKFLLNRGETRKARGSLLPVVRRQQRVAWVWSLLGATYEQEDPETAVTCYFRAVQLARQPQEVANTRVKLARLLAARERFADAAVQVRAALAYRHDNGFRVPQGLGQLAETGWYRELAECEDLPREPEMADAVDVILFAGKDGQLEYRLGVVDNQNTDKALAHVAFSAGEGNVLPYSRFKGIRNVPIGEIVEVGFSGDTHHAIRWRNSDRKDIEGFVKTMTGEVTQRDDQAFGFMRTNEDERIFIHPSLMDQLSSTGANPQTCLAMMGKDKKGKEGWRALVWCDMT